MTFENGSTLSLLGESAKDVNLDNLSIANNSTVNLKFDWGDTLNSSSSKINGKLNVNEINLAKTNGTDNEYTFTNLGNKVALDNNINLSGVSANTNNFVTYNNTNGKLFSKRKSLVSAVDETGSSETNTYSMTGNETAGGETLVGTLTVQGNGNTITESGIIVGDSTNKATLTLKDVNLDNVNVDDSSKGALHVNGGSELKIVADTKNVTLANTKGSATNAIYLESDAANGTAKVTIETNSGIIKISDDITSNDKNNEVIFTGNKNIEFSGKFDPVQATVKMSGAELIRSEKQDKDIYWILNGGTLRYTDDNLLSGGTNTLDFQGGSLDLRNGAVNFIDLAGLTLTQSSNLYLDADLANKTMDTFNVDIANIKTPNTSAKLHVAGFNLISDAQDDETKINFVPQASGLTGFVDYTGSQGLKALSPIYRYNVAYDETNGDFTFSRFAGGGYNSFNPAILAAPVAAQLGGYLTQLNSYDEAFRNMDMYMLMTKKQRQAMKLRNKYASATGGLAYDPLMAAHYDKAVWFRPYATFESVALKNGPKVNNTAYGTFFGGESELFEHANGWDTMYGVYAGYNGSRQSYDNVSIYQNGGTLGLVGMAYKGNFFTGLTLNTGASVAQASTMYGSEDLTMLMAGIASKTGYNLELGRGENRGKFIIQPSLLMSYSFVNTFDYTNAAGIHVNSDPLNAIQIEPGVKFIGNLKNGWQPYAGVSMVWNVIDKTKFQANNVSLPDMSIKPFVKYGLGVRKTWGEKFTGFLQAYITNGGRNGIGLQAGFSILLGKNNSRPISQTNHLKLELPKTEVELSQLK